MKSTRQRYTRLSYFSRLIKTYLECLKEQITQKFNLLSCHPVRLFFFYGTQKENFFLQLKVKDAVKQTKFYYSLKILPSSS